MPAPDDAAPGGLQVISRAAQILRMLDAQRPEVRINDVAAELGIGRTSAYRYLQSLAVEGFLERVGDGGSYRLGPLLAGLGASVLSESGVIEVAGPFLEQLAGTTPRRRCWASGPAPTPSPSCARSRRARPST